MSENEPFSADVPKPDVTAFSQRFFEARGTAVPRVPEVIAAEEEWQTDKNHPLRFLKEHNGQRNWLKIWGLLMPIYEDFKATADKKSWHGPLEKQLFQDEGYDEAALGPQRWRVVNMYIDYLMAAAAQETPADATARGATPTTAPLEATEALETTNRQWSAWDSKAVEAAVELVTDDASPTEPEPNPEPLPLRPRIRNSEPGDFTRDRATHRKPERDHKGY